MLVKLTSGKFIRNIETYAPSNLTITTLLSHLQNKDRYVMANICRGFIAQRPQIGGHRDFNLSIYHCNFYILLRSDLVVKVLFKFFPICFDSMLVFL